MPDMNLSLQEARNILLTAQGLSQPPVEPATKADVLAAIRRMQVLQIDTIHVIARSPYLVLWSRLGDYNCAWLDELLSEGALFEYWAHAACFLPIEDYPLYRRRMIEGIRGWSDVPKWIAEHREVTDMVLERIRREGAVRSADFETEKPHGPWWNWKDEKTALECLFIQGELMIARRQNFQRVYDLRERVLPGWNDGREDANIPSWEEVQRIFTLRGVRALGVAHNSWAHDYFRLQKTGNAQRLEALADEGLLRRVEIDGMPGPAYLDPQADLPAKPSTVTTMLSMFDPVIWDRKRLKDLFNFDYQIECYTPAPKRRYGYFTLPILHNGALVGRLDPKAHRDKGLFEVKALYLEPGVEPSDALAAGLADALRRLAAWHGTPEVVIRRSEPEEFADHVQKFL